MVRYSVLVGSLWVAAVYDATGSGIALTERYEDACSWASHERAMEAARVVSAAYGDQAWIYVTVEQPSQPLSWSRVSVVNA